MSRPILLASASSVRAQMLRKAGLRFDVVPASVDEAAIRAGMEAEQANPRDIADALAEFKAQKVAGKHPDALVIGCDQVLQYKGHILGKCDTIEAARATLQKLRGQRHSLLSAVVLYDEGKPIWRHVGLVRLTMRDFSDGYLDAYLQRNWPDVQAAVGCYMLEEEGVRLFSAVEGDYFTVLGLPLLPLLAQLTRTGYLDA